MHIATVTQCDDTPWQAYGIEVIRLLLDTQRELQAAQAEIAHLQKAGPRCPRCGGDGDDHPAAVPHGRVDDRGRMSLAKAHARCEVLEGELRETKLAMREVQAHNRHLEIQLAARGGEFKRQDWVRQR
jgi:hypothetical protein